MQRTAVAFWIAPLWAPVLLSIWAAFSVQPTLGFPVMAALLSAMFAYASMLEVGLPAFLIMRARTWTGVRAAAIVGAIAGLSISYLGLVLLLLLRGPEFVAWSAFAQAFDPTFLSVSGIVGILVSTTFWAIARPDRTPPPSSRTHAVTVSPR